MSDRSAPTFTCQVIVGTGAAQRLTDGVQVKSWDLEETETAHDKLKLTVDNYTLANFDDPIWAEGNELRFSFGYPGNMSPTYEALITKVESKRTQLSVEALSKGLVMNKIPFTRIFENMKRSDIARQIAKEYGYTDAQIDIDDTTEVLEHVAQARQTDQAFLRELSHKEGFIACVDVGGFHFHKRRPEQKPSFSFTYFTDKTGTVIDFDIGGGKKRNPTAVVVKGVDLAKKQPIVAVATNESGAKPNGLAAGVPQVGVKVADDGSMSKEPAATDLTCSSHVEHTTEKTTETAQRKADGVLNKTQSAVVKGKFTLVGHPQVHAKTVVEILGLGKTYSGNYYVTKAHHKGGGKYETHIEARRDGHSQVGPGLAASKAKVNTADGPPADAPPTLQRQVVVDADGTTHAVYVNAPAKQGGT